MNSIGIGALAKRAGVRIDRVRYTAPPGAIYTCPTSFSSVSVIGNALRLRFVRL